MTKRQRINTFDLYESVESIVEVNRGNQDKPRRIEGKKLIEKLSIIVTAKSEGKSKIIN